MKNVNKLKVVFTLVLAVILLILPISGVSDYLIRIAIMLMIYVITSVGLNLISGETGQVSMGQAGFFAVGAYSSALLAMKLGIPVIICIILAAFLAGIVATLIGRLALRLSGGYLAVITLALSEAIRLVIINWSSMTNGNVGLTAIPRPRLFSIRFEDYHAFYYMTLVFTIMMLFFSRNLIKSHFGLRLRMIKNDEIAAQNCGLNILRIKVAAFGLAGLFGGLGGALYAHLMRFLDPTVAANTKSNLFLCMVVLGGMGNMTGTVIAAIVLGLLPEVLRGFDELNQLIYGLILIFAMLSRAKNISISSIKKKIFDRSLKKTG